MNEVQINSSSRNDSLDNNMQGLNVSLNSEFSVREVINSEPAEHEHDKDDLCEKDIIRRLL